MKKIIFQIKGSRYMRAELPGRKNMFFLDLLVYVCLLCSQKLWVVFLI